MKKAFTILELVIVIAIISIISAVLAPTFVSYYDKSKEEIIKLHNDQQIQVIDEHNAVIYEGRKEDIDLMGYEILDVTYSNQLVVILVKKK